MPTQTLPDIDAFTEIVEDFSLPCEVVEITLYAGVVSNRRQCEREAQFTGLYPCCAHRVMSCERHVKDGQVWACGKCHRDIPGNLIAWTRL
jgi:hypothetical protein